MKTTGIAWVGVLALLAGVVVLAVNLADTEPRVSTSPLINQAAPAFDLPRLDGSGNVQLDDFAGKIVLVNFFASWCLECRLEHADLTAAANTLAPDVALIGITYLDTPEDANGFLDELGRADSAEYLFDEPGFASIEYGLFGVPETFFIDATGTIVAKVTGPANLGLILSIVDDIKAGKATGVTETGTPQGSPND